MFRVGIKFEERGLELGLRLGLGRAVNGCVKAGGRRIDEP
jgi:hypothetical protein